MESDGDFPVPFPSGVFPPNDKGIGARLALVLQEQERGEARMVETDIEDTVMLRIAADSRARQLVSARREEDLRERVERLQGEVRRKDRDKERLELKVSQLETVILTLGKGREEEQRRLETRNRKLQNRVKQLREEIVKKSCNISAKEDCVDDLKDELNIVENKKDQTLFEMQGLNHALQKSHKRVEEVEEELAGARVYRVELLQEMQDRAQQLAEVTKKLATQNQLNSKLLAESVELQEKQKNHPITVQELSKKIQEALVKEAQYKSLHKTMFDARKKMEMKHSAEVNLWKERLSLKNIKMEGSKREVKVEEKEDFRLGGKVEGGAEGQGLSLRQKRELQRLGPHLTPGRRDFALAPRSKFRRSRSPAPQPASSSIPGVISTSGLLVKDVLCFSPCSAASSSGQQQGRKDQAGPGSPLLPSLARLGKRRTSSPNKGESSGAEAAQRVCDQTTSQKLV